MHTVDVILPFHRNDEYLRIAIDSALSSKDVEVRLLLIDDRKIWEPIQDLDAYVTCRTGGIGYAGAINSARKHLQSNYVALMNSDDWSDPERLKKQISAITFGESEFSICALKKFRGLKSLTANLGELTGDKYDPRSLILGAYGANATLLGTREAWLQEVFFFESDVSDWVTAFQLLPRIMPEFVNETLYWYRQHENQITNSSSHQIKSTEELLDHARLLALRMGIWDKDFDMNFKITATPYSLRKPPAKTELLTAWRYLDSIEELNIYGVKNLLRRRRLFLGLYLMKLGFINFKILGTVVGSSLEYVLKKLDDFYRGIPRLLESSILREVSE